MRIIFKEIAFEIKSRIQNYEYKEVILIVSWRGEFLDLTKSINSEIW